MRSGKSTALRLFVGLVRPGIGTVAGDGVPVPVPVPVAGAGVPAARRRLGYVIQEGGPFPHLEHRVSNISRVARHRVSVMEPTPAGPRRRHA